MIFANRQGLFVTSSPPIRTQWYGSRRHELTVPAPPQPPDGGRLIQRSSRRTSPFSLDGSPVVQVIIARVPSPEGDSAGPLKLPQDLRPGLLPAVRCADWRMGTVKSVANPRAKARGYRKSVGNPGPKGPGYHEPRAKARGYHEPQIMQAATWAAPHRLPHPPAG